MYDNSGVIAAAIAGGTLGTTGGFMYKSQESENNGDAPWTQVGKGALYGIKTGAVGAGVGLGASAATIAVRRMLGR